MNIQFEWNHQNYNKHHFKDQTPFNSNIMHTMTTKDNKFTGYNPGINIYDNNNQDKGFPFQHPLYYTLLPDYEIPQSFPLTEENVFPQKHSNEMDSNAFEDDINEFDSSEQIEDHILNTLDSNGLIESPLIIDKNIISNPKLNESIDKEAVIQLPVRYFEDFSSDYKNQRFIKSDSIKSIFGTNGNNKWKPLDKVIENPKERNLIKNNRQIDTSLQRTVSPTVQTILSQHLSSRLSAPYLTTSTTSAPKVLIPSYIRRKYLIDLGKHEVKASPLKISNYFRNVTKKWPKNNGKFELLKDWSMKLTNNSSQLFPTLNKKPIIENKSKNEIIVQKIHSNYTKSSVIYSIEDSFEDKTLESDLNDKNEFNFNRIEVKTISKITKNDMKNELRGKPGIDYPIYSPSVLSNFTCSGPGFYADTQFGCQMYHHCEEHDYHQKFICPNGTLFNVRIQSCDYWFNVKCDHNSKKDLLIQDFKTQINGNLKTDNTLSEEPMNRQIIKDIKAFVERISKTKV